MLPKLGRQHRSHRDPEAASRNAVSESSRSRGLVQKAGADQITVHLREDRRHIQDEDVRALRADLRVPLNLEMACTDAMVKFARARARLGCLVPEKRQEVTTEGGLDIAKNQTRVGKTIEKLKKAGIRVSCFIEPSLQAVKLSRQLGADAVEFHTGQLLPGRARRATARAPRRSSNPSSSACASPRSPREKRGFDVHAGHGFDYENVRPVVALVEDEASALIEEYNIGHSIVCRAALSGLSARSVKCSLPFKHRKAMKEYIVMRMRICTSSEMRDLDETRRQGIRPRRRDPDGKRRARRRRRSFWKRIRSPEGNGNPRFRRKRQ